MEKKPLTVRNGGISAIPKPLSKIPMPMKRPLTSEMDKENETEPPVPKKAKISSVRASAKSAVTKRPTAASGALTSTRTATKTASTKPIYATKPISTKPASAKPGSAAGRPTASRPTASRPSKPAAKPVKVPSLAVTATARSSAMSQRSKTAPKVTRPLSGRGTSRSTSIEALSEQLAQLTKRLDDMETVKAEQAEVIQVKEKESSAATHAVQALEDELASVRSRHRTECAEYEEKLAVLERRCRSLTMEKEDLDRNLTICRSSLAQLTTDMATIQGRYDAMKLAKECAMEESAGKSATIAALEKEVKRHLTTITEANSRIRDDELLRRKLHNTIQELKGNIRVFCRVRPALPDEVGFLSNRRISDDFSSRGTGSKKKVDSKLHIEFPDSSAEAKKITLKYSGDQTVTGMAAALKSYMFEFDKTFGPATSQEEVFSEISQLVQSSLDGYNVCIFAYGQTGSGKTFTMEGPERPSHRLTVALHPGLEEDRRGMVPRALEQVFQSSQALRKQGWEYKLEASFLEIYNETIRDLLSNSSASHDIKIDPANPGSTYVTNLKSVVVTSQQQVATLLEQAARNRAVAATQCNERSSRSHSVFRLHITGRNTITDQTHKSSLNLIDLAGSERLASSGSSGERLKETKNINKSLSNLGQVIMALANKDHHIPYRNSKLTYLLQDSLGGNSKTLMFVNMSPLASCFQESLCSLRFAMKVNECNIGVARKSTTK